DTRRWTMVVRLPPASASQASADHTDQRVELFDAHPAGRDEEDPQQNGPADQDGGEGSRDALADRLADAVTGGAAEQGGRDGRDAQPRVGPQHPGAVQVA